MGPFRPFLTRRVVFGPNFSLRFSIWTRNGARRRELGEIGQELRSPIFENLISPTLNQTRDYLANLLVSRNYSFITDSNVVSYSFGHLCIPGVLSKTRQQRSVARPFCRIEVSRPTVQNCLGSHTLLSRSGNSQGTDSPGNVRNVLLITERSLVHQDMPAIPFFDANGRRNCPFNLGRMTDDVVAQFVATSYELLYSSGDSIPNFYDARAEVTRSSRLTCQG
jgi:hypothetical protein